ncbi:MAG: hypothetical protein QME64_04410 [bacterium]|nr:hypothetical protein [bacterium]
MQLGINWKKDTTLGKYRELFTNRAVRQSLGKQLQRVLSHTGYIRYPGGTYVQEFALDNRESETDYSFPGYPLFYQFCLEYNLQILQQFPTTKLAQDGQIKLIKSTVKGPVDWSLVDRIIREAQAMVKWVNAHNFAGQVAYWEFGNEDYHDRELRLRPQEYVEIVTRYISALRDLIPPEKLLIVARLGNRGGSQNWGDEVLKLLKENGAANSIGGVTTHLYPYFLNRAYCDSADFEFNEYCLSERLLQSCLDEYQQLADTLATLGYAENIKIHITEIGIDIPGPIRSSDNQHTFGYNRKNYAAAVGITRTITALAEAQRFGSAAYYCFLHKYLLAPEALNPTRWKRYTTVDDWGWGQCWYVPQEPAERFINTPVLEAWSFLVRLLGNATQIKKLDSQTYLAVADELRMPVRLLWLNLTSQSKTVPVTGATPGMQLGNGNLNQRAIRLGSEGNQADRTLVTPQPVKLNGAVQLPPYSILFAQGNDLKLNRVPIVPEFIRTRAMLNGEPLSLGEFSIQYSNRKLVLFPEGVVLENYPLSAIMNKDGLTEAELAAILFGTSPSTITEWKIFTKEHSDI